MNEILNKVSELVNSSKNIPQSKNQLSKQYVELILEKTMVKYQLKE